MTQRNVETCLEDLSIVLLAAEPAARTVQESLLQQFGATVRTVPGYQQCQALLEQEEVGLLLLEETFLLEDQAAAESLYAMAGNALVLEINFGVSDADRIVRQVGSALRHRTAEAARARAAASAAVRNELSAAVAGLLLESELLLRKAGPELVPHLHQVVTLAEAVSRQLRSPDRAESLPHRLVRESASHCV